MEAASRLFAGSPALTASHRDDRAGKDTGFREQELGVAAPVWRWGQRDATREAALAEQAEAEAAVRLLRWTLAGRVNDRAWEALASQRDVEMAQARLLALKSLQADVDKRVNAGDMARSDALLIGQERLAAENALRDARVLHLEALHRLHQIAGVERLPVLPEPAIESAQEEEATGAELPHKTIQPDLIDRHPQVLAARAARARAEAKLREIGHARREPIELGVGVRWQRDEARQPSDRSMGFSVRVPLGEEPRAPHAYATALTEVDVLRSEEQRAVEAVERDMHEAEAALSSSKASTASSAQRARQALERLALIRTAFDMGEQGMAERLRAEAAAREASQQLARDRATLGRAQARFEQARGVLP